MQGIDGIIKFQKDRQLDKQEFNSINEITNIIEELFESIGYDIPQKNREQFQYELQKFIDKLWNNDIIDNDDDFVYASDTTVDAYADIIVFAIGAIMKLGYDPKLALKEVSKEINSRTGSIINGKFEKDLSPKAKAKWYKANFSTCKYHRD